MSAALPFVHENTITGFAEKLRGGPVEQNMELWQNMGCESKGESRDCSLGRCPKARARLSTATACVDATNDGICLTNCRRRVTYASTTTTCFGCACMQLKKP